MKRTLMILVLAGLSVGSWSADGEGQDKGKSNPGSLYGASSKNPYVDRVAMQEGDVLLVMIDEQSAATFAAATAASKNDGTTVSADVLKGFIGRIFGPLTSSASGSTNGTGNTSHTSKMTAKMSVVVKEVMPTGDLAIEGSRTLVTNKETQTFTLSGIVRRADITPANTVDSNRIAEAEIRLTAKGQVADRQRKGVLSQFLDWLF